MSALKAEQSNEEHTEEVAASVQPDKQSLSSTVTMKPYGRPRSEECNDEKLAAENGLPATAAAITEMSMADLHQLLESDGLSEHQKLIIRKLRNRGKCRIAARASHEQRVMKHSGAFRTIACDKCEKRYTSLRGLQLHIYNAHGGDVDPPSKQLHHLWTRHEQWENIEQFSAHLANAHPVFAGASDYSEERGRKRKLIQPPRKKYLRSHPPSACNRGTRFFCKSNACERCIKLRVFRCDQCENSYLTAKGLRTHTNAHHNGRLSKRVQRLLEMLNAEMMCPICSRSFFVASYYEVTFIKHFAEAHLDFDGDVLSLVEVSGDEEEGVGHQFEKENTIFDGGFDPPPPFGTCIADLPEEAEMKEDMNGEQIIAEVFGPAERPRVAAQGVKEEVEEIWNMDVSGSGVGDVKEEYGEELLAVREEEPAGNGNLIEIKEELEQDEEEYFYYGPQYLP